MVSIKNILPVINEGIFIISISCYWLLSLVNNGINTIFLILICLEFAWGCFCFTEFFYLLPLHPIRTVLLY